MCPICSLLPVTVWSVICCCRHRPSAPQANDARGHDAVWQSNAQRATTRRPTCTDQVLASCPPARASRAHQLGDHATTFKLCSESQRQRQLTSTASSSAVAAAAAAEAFRKRWYSRRLGQRPNGRVGAGRALLVSVCTELRLLGLNTLIIHPSLSFHPSINQSIANILSYSEAISCPRRGESFLWKCRHSPLHDCDAAAAAAAAS